MALIAHQVSTTWNTTCKKGLETPAGFPNDAPTVTPFGGTGDNFHKKFTLQYIVPPGETVQLVSGSGFLQFWMTNTVSARSFPAKMEIQNAGCSRRQRINAPINFTAPVTSPTVPVHGTFEFPNMNAFSMTAGWRVFVEIKANDLDSSQAIWHNGLDGTIYDTQLQIPVFGIAPVNFVEVLDETVDVTATNTRTLFFFRITSANVNATAVSGNFSPFTRNSVQQVSIVNVTATNDFHFVAGAVDRFRVHSANVNVTATNNAVLSGTRIGNANVNVTAVSDFHHVVAAVNYTRVSDATVNATATNDSTLSFVRVSDATVNATATDDFFWFDAPTLWTRVSDANVNTTAANDFLFSAVRVSDATVNATATDDFFWFDFPFQWSRVSDANVNVTATNNAVLSGIRVSDANVNVTSTNDFFHPIVPKMWIRVTSATVNVAAGTNHFQAFRDISSGSVNVTGIVTGENWNLPDKRIGVGSSNVNVTATNVFVKVTQFTAWTRVSNANVNTTAANNSSSAFSRDTSGTVNVTATDDFSHVIGPVLFTRDASANVNVTATDSEHVTRSPVTTANVNVTATTNFVFTTQATGWFTKGRVYKHFAGDSTAFLVASIAGGPGGSQAFARLIEVDSNGNEIGPVGGASVATSNPAMQSIESVGFTLTVGKLYKVQFSNAGAAGTYSGASIVLR